MQVWHATENLWRNGDFSLCENIQKLSQVPGATLDQF